MPQSKTRLIAWLESWLLAGLAWIPTAVLGWGMPPAPGTMGMSLGAFLGFWTMMMAAMMLPALAPVLTCHLDALTLRNRGWLLAVRGGAFVLGYLLFWGACGLPLYVLALLEMFLIRVFPFIALEVEALVLVAVGLYQLTPFQAACLTSCRLKQRRLPSCAHADSLLRDVGIGVRSGLDCLGACGGLMLLLFVVGFMNLPWMLVITLLVVLEKGWHYGHSLALAVGIGLLLLGIFAASDPGLIPGGVLGSLR